MATDTEAEDGSCSPHHRKKKTPCKSLWRKEKEEDFMLLMVMSYFKFLASLLTIPHSQMTHNINQTW